MENILSTKFIFLIKNMLNTEAKFVLKIYKAKYFSIK